MSKREPISNEEPRKFQAAYDRVLADLDRVSKERLASANALDDAQREIARLKQEIAEDAKATAESQEITGKYMADAESAQKEIAAYRQSGALEALRWSQRSGLKPGCDCEACRIETQRRSAIAALEAIEKSRAVTGGQG